MTVGQVLAVLVPAATVFGASWAVWIYWRRHRLRLSLTAERGPDRVAAAFARGDGPVSALVIPTVQVRLINRGRTVRVESVGWVDPDVHARTNHVTMGMHDQPVEVPSNDGKLLEVDTDHDLAERDAMQPLDFWVTLTTGETLYAEDVRMMRPMCRVLSPRFGCAHGISSAGGDRPPGPSRGGCEAS